MTVCCPCPCCGHVVFAEPGSDEICPICFWQDDIVQLRWPDMPGGANSVSLIEAQQNFIDHKVSEMRFLKDVRLAEPNERIDPGWRPLNVDADVLESSLPGSRYWPDHDQFYWWRSTYWLR